MAPVGSISVKRYFRSDREKHCKDDELPMENGWLPAFVTRPSQLCRQMGWWSGEKTPLFLRVRLVKSPTGINSGHKFEKQVARCPISSGGSRIRWAAWHAGTASRELRGGAEHRSTRSLFAPHFNSTGKDFFLFDTFEEYPEEQMTEREMDDRIRENQDLYGEAHDIACRTRTFPEEGEVDSRKCDNL